MSKILIDEAVVGQALEALEYFEDAIRYDNEQDDIGARVCCGVLSYNPHEKDCKAVKAITALRQALEQPAPAQEPDRQELQAAGIHPAPCARHCEANAFQIAAREMRRQIAELQAALAEQPAQPWVGLTDEEIDDIEATWEATQEWVSFSHATRVIEAKLKEKNT
jgi:hypothetical protein